MSIRLNIQPTIIQEEEQKETEDTAPTGNCIQGFRVICFRQRNNLQPPVTGQTLPATWQSINSDLGLPRTWLQQINPIFFTQFDVISDDQYKVFNSIITDGAER